MGFLTWNPATKSSEDQEYSTATVKGHGPDQAHYPESGNELNNSAIGSAENASETGWGWFNNPLRNLSLSEVASAFVVYEDVDYDDEEGQEMEEDDDEEDVEQERKVPKLDLSDKLLSAVQSEFEQHSPRTDVGVAMAVPKRHDAGAGAMRMPKIDCISDNSIHSCSSSESSDKSSTVVHLAGQDSSNEKDKGDNMAVVVGVGEGEHHSRWFPNTLRHISLEQITSAFVSYEEDDDEEDQVHPTDQGEDAEGANIVVDEDEETEEYKNQTKGERTSVEDDTKSDDKNNNNNNNNKGREPWFNALAHSSMSQVSSAFFSYEEGGSDSEEGDVEGYTTKFENPEGRNCDSPKSVSRMFGTLTIIEEDIAMTPTTKEEDSCDDTYDELLSSEGGGHEKKHERTQKSAGEVDEVNVWYMIFLEILSSLKKKMKSSKKSNKESIPETNTSYNYDDDEKDENDDEADESTCSEGPDHSVQQEQGAAPVVVQ